VVLNLKQAAGERACEYVKDGMVVGLGTGSTAYYAIKRLGMMVTEGLDITGIPTSISSEKLAQESGIRLSTLEEHPDKSPYPFCNLSWYPHSTLLTLLF